MSRFERVKNRFKSSGKNIKKKGHFAGKKTKHISRGAVMKVLNFTKRRSLSIVNLLIKMGLARQTTKVKMLSVVVPLISLTLIDNFIVAIVITSIDLFFCALCFSMTTVHKSEAYNSDYDFDYGKYKYLCSVREVYAIIAISIFVMLSIIIGHSTVEGFLENAVVL